MFTACLSAFSPSARGLTTGKEDGGHNAQLGRTYWFVFGSYCTTWQGRASTTRHGLQSLSPHHEGGLLSCLGLGSPLDVRQADPSLGKATSLPHGMGKGLVVFWSPTAFFSPHRLVRSCPRRTGAVPDTERQMHRQQSCCGYVGTERCCSRLWIPASSHIPRRGIPG